MPAHTGTFSVHTRGKGTTEITREVEAIVGPRTSVVRASISSERGRVRFDGLVVPPGRHSLRLDLGLFMRRRFADYVATLRRMCEERGLAEGNTSTPGASVIERAFADA